MDFAAALQTMSDTTVQLQVFAKSGILNANLIAPQAYVPQGDTPVKSAINLPATLKRFRDEKEVLAAARLNGMLAKAAASPTVAGKSPRTPLSERHMNLIAADNS